jgi:hypothetical protein
MRITGRQLRRIIQEEVARMINEEAVPRSVEDGISQIVVAAFPGAAFEGPPENGGGVKIGYAITKSNPMEFWSHAPVTKARNGKYITMSGRNYRGRGGGIQLEIFAPGGMIGPSEDANTIDQLLDDVVSENLAELGSALEAAGGKMLKGSLTVQVPSAKFNFNDISALLGPAGPATVPSASPAAPSRPPPVRK